MTGFPGFRLYVKLGSCPRPGKSCLLPYGLWNKKVSRYIQNQTEFPIWYEIQEQQIIFGISPKMILVDYTDMVELRFIIYPGRIQGVQIPGSFQYRYSDNFLVPFRTINQASECCSSTHCTTNMGIPD